MKRGQSRDEENRPRKVLIEREDFEKFFVSGLKSLFLFSFFLLSLPLLPISFPFPPLLVTAAAAASYPRHQSSPESDEEDLSDLDTLQDETTSSRHRYKQLRSTPPRPTPGPPPQRGMRGARGGGPPRGGPRGNRGTARSYSSESSRQPGVLLTATHTVSAPFPTSHLPNDGDVFSVQCKS